MQLTTLSLNPLPLIEFYDYTQPALQVITSGLSSGDAEERKEVAQVVWGMCLDRPGVLSLIVEPALQDRNATTQLGGLAIINDCLQTLASEEMPVELILTKVRAPDFEVRVAAVRALRFYQGRDFTYLTGRLRAHLENEANPMMRLALYDALLERDCVDLEEAYVAECIRLMNNPDVHINLHNKAIQTLRHLTRTLSNRHRAGEIEMMLDEHSQKIRDTLKVMVGGSLLQQFDDQEITALELKEKFIQNLQSPLWRFWQFKIVPLLKRVIDFLDRKKDARGKIANTFYMSRNNAQAAQELTQQIEKALNVNLPESERLAAIDQMNVRHFSEAHWQRLQGLLTNTSPVMQKKAQHLYLKAYKISPEGNFQANPILIGEAYKLLEASFNKAGENAAALHECEEFERALAVLNSISPPDLERQLTAAQTQRLKEIIFSARHAFSTIEDCQFYEVDRLIPCILASLGETEFLLKSARTLVGQNLENESIVHGMVTLFKALGPAASEFLPELKNKLEATRKDRSHEGPERAARIATHILTIATPRRYATLAEEP